MAIERTPVKITEADRPMKFVDIVERAVAGNAFVRSHDEAGDDTCLVQFPQDSEPRYYTDDQLLAAIREFNNPGCDDE